jgi:choline dehydrogenase-like flavoprotein
MMNNKINKRLKGNIKTDVIVVGSGPAGALVANRLAKKNATVLVLEAGKIFDKKSDISRGIFENYWNGGIIPMLGPFMLPFGQARVLGGGTVINGALFWPTPKKTLERWQKELPGSVYNSPTWEKTEVNVAKEFGATASHPSYEVGNLPSKLLKSAAENLSWDVVRVPRAVKKCRNTNRCASGCQFDAKNTSLNLLNDDKRRITVKTKASVYKITKCKSGEWLINFKQAGKNMVAQSKKVVLSAGATESANLLKRSALSSQAGKYFQFHVNFKIVAKFNHAVNATLGTILTEQVQEFINQDMLLMTSNFSNSYLASSLTNLSVPIFKKYIEEIQNIGIYTLMIRPNVIGSVNNLWGQTYIRWSWDSKSMILVKEGLIKLAKLLFEAGANEVVLPLKTNAVIAKNIKEVNSIISDIHPSDLIGVSVHGMSACKMGLSPYDSVVNLDGQVWNQENLFVVDTSILPSNTGESPQGTILATADEMCQRWV